VAGGGEGGGRLVDFVAHAVSGTASKAARARGDVIVMETPLGGYTSGR